MDNRMNIPALQLLRQYRLDVAIISFGAYIAGLVFSSGFDPGQIPAGLAISLISFNYIYSLNSIEDRDIDRINKPGRPIPAGRLDLGLARRYVSILLVLSIIYPFFVYKNIINLVLYFLLPFLGWAYSVPPLRLKTKAILAAVSIVIMYLTPIAIGLTSNLETLRPMHASLLGYFLLFILSIVPLKDIEDVEGDQLLGSSNWMAMLGLRKLLAFSILGLMTSIILIFLSDLGILITFDLIALSTSTAILIGLFVIFRLPSKHLYRSILILVGSLGLALFVFILLFGRGL
jgi:geranylgeranylglycerol-phosphate geranylgeranyltransferase